MAYIWKVKGAYIFHNPVDPIQLKIEDYFTIIKRPMDFGTIKVNKIKQNNLNNNVYRNYQSFIEDVNL